MKWGHDPAKKKSWIACRNRRSIQVTSYELRIGLASAWRRPVRPAARCSQLSADVSGQQVHQQLRLAGPQVGDELLGY